MEIDEAILNMGRLAIIIIALSVAGAVIAMVFALMKRTVLGKPSIPNDFDNDADKIVEAAKSAVQNIKKRSGLFTSHKSNINYVSEKIRLLNELELLKAKQLIGTEEYHSLRNEIMKQ